MLLVAQFVTFDIDQLKVLPNYLELEVEPKIEQILDIKNNVKLIYSFA